MPLKQLVFPSPTLAPVDDGSASDEKIFELDSPGDPDLPPDPTDADGAPVRDDAGDFVLGEIVEGAASRSGRGPSASDDYHDDTSALMQGGSDLALDDAFQFGPLPDIDDPHEGHLPDPGDAGGAPDGDGGYVIYLSDVTNSSAEIPTVPVDCDFIV